VDAITYLEGGERGDEIAHRMLAAVPALLAPDGEALLSFHAPGEPDRAAAFLLSSITADELDVAVLAVHGPAAPEAAAGFGYVRDPTGGPAFVEAVERYHEVLAAQGATSACLVALRRRGRTDPVHAAATVGTLPATREALDAWLTGLDLGAADDDEVLASTLRAPGETHLVVERLAGDTDAELQYRLRFPAGALPADRGLTELAAGLLDEVCATATVGDALLAFADTTGVTPEEVREVVLGFVRDSLTFGVLGVAR
jgi:hypothetical protein